ncbi:4'-phosphopantetheinyl transferase superfamily protein [Nibribacter ruber]|uniref:Enterobactin synthase component D n=1 Tax=Nibribacter ruber TaxID=2698458 RepID=A0A6P1P391_9BACT|nr:4'-phosphopantetheinyl transferase family protein [Nibribacter ruber]QHL88860.1 4'-phosphopantetheinyl transferase superfamily protein [Nibribacter ruber]
MPLHHIHTIDENTVLGIWQIQEDVEDLTFQLLSLRPATELPFFKAEARRREWLASRLLVALLLEKLGHPAVLLQKQETGQPYLQGADVQVSITHSGSWAAVLLSATHEVGIDIEIIGKKVQRAAHRFLNEQELSFLQADEEKMHVYWSAKETLYKVYARRQLDFRRQLLVEDFEKAPAGRFGGTVAVPEKTLTYTVHYQISREFVLTYVLAPLSQ